jgi:hypothetical protein
MALVRVRLAVRPVRRGSNRFFEAHVVAPALQRDRAEELALRVVGLLQQRAVHHHARKVPQQGLRARVRANPGRLVGDPVVSR